MNARLSALILKGLRNGMSADCILKGGRVSTLQKPRDPASIAPAMPPAFRKTAILLNALAASLVGYSCLNVRSGGSIGPSPSSVPAPTAVAVPSPAPSEKPENLVLRAEALLEKDDLEAAAAFIDQAARSKDDDPALRLLRGSILLSEGKADEARKIAEGVLAERPDDPEALYLLSAVEWTLGNDAKRKEYLDRVLKANPRHGQALADLGDIWYEGKIYVKAEESYRAALRSEPKNVDALLGMGRVGLRAGDYDEAEKYQGEAIKINPTHSVAWAERSRTRYFRGDYRGSVEDSTKAIEFANGNPWNYIERARAYLDIGKNDEALADFDRAIELDPGYYLSYVMRAGILEGRGEDARALADYKMAAKLFPAYFYSFESIGILSMKKDLWADAAVAFVEAFKRSDADYNYAIMAVNTYARAGDAKAGKALASELLPRIDRELNAARYLLLRLYLENGDSTEAEYRIMSTKRLDERAMLLYFLAEYWMSRGKTELAMKYHLYVREMGRAGTMADRLNEFELKKLEIAPGASK
jgi:tetratricopeptide (TPR) repeat protein